MAPGMFSLLLGGGAALLSAVVLLLVGAVLVSSGVITQAREPQLVTGVVLIGAVIGGVIAKRGWTHKKLVAAMLSGAVFFCFLAVIGLLGFSGVNVVQNGVGNLAGALCGGALAGVLGRTRGKKGKRRNRK